MSGRPGGFDNPFDSGGSGGSGSDSDDESDGGSDLPDEFVNQQIESSVGSESDSESQSQSQSDSDSGGSSGGGSSNKVDLDDISVDSGMSGSSAAGSSSGSSSRPQRPDDPGLAGGSSQPSGSGSSASEPQGESVDTGQANDGTTETETQTVNVGPELGGDPAESGGTSETQTVSFGRELGGDPVDATGNRDQATIEESTRQELGGPRTEAETDEQLDIDLGAEETEFREPDIGDETPIRDGLESKGSELSELGGQAGDAVADRLTDRDTFLDETGALLASAPTDIGLTVLDAGQATEEVIGDTIREGPGAGADTADNIVRNVGESAIEGFDRTVDVQPDGAAGDLPRFEVREQARQRVAAGATLFAGSLAASPVGPSFGPSVLGRAARGRRRQTQPDGGPTVTDGGERTITVERERDAESTADQFTVERERDAEPTAEQSVNDEELVGGDGQNISDNDIPDSFFEQDVESRLEDATVDLGQDQPDTDLRTADRQTRGEDPADADSAQSQTVSAREFNAQREREQVRQQAESTRNRAESILDRVDETLEVTNDRDVQTSNPRGDLLDDLVREDSRDRQREADSQSVSQTIAQSTAAASATPSTAAEQSLSTRTQLGESLSPLTLTTTTTDQINIVQQQDTRQGDLTRTRERDLTRTRERDATQTRARERDRSLTRTRERDGTRTRQRDRDRPRTPDFPELGFGDDDDDRSGFGLGRDERIEEVLTLDTDPLDGFLTEDDT